MLPRKLRINDINGIQRFIVVFVLFLGVVMNFFTRHSLNLAMTKLNPKVETKSLSFTETYVWNSKLESYIHAAFYVGYVPGKFCHAPGAYLTEKFGGKIVLNVSLFAVCILTALTPISVKFGQHIGLIILRFVMGIMAAPVFPAVGNLLSAWVPPKERSVSSASVLGGVQIGSMLSGFLPGEILHNTKGYGTVFFIISGICLAWCILFQFTVTDRPEHHPRIGDEEKDYLHREIGELCEKKKNSSEIPWTCLLTSKPVWALIIAQIGHDWAVFFMSSYIPKYFKNALELNFQLAGRYIGLAYFIAWIFSIFCGHLSGFLIRRNITTITWSRKIFTILSTVVPGVFLVLGTYVSHEWAIACMILCLGLMGAFYAGNRINVLDICPNYTASLLGLVNGIGAVGGLIAIFSAGILMPNNEGRDWQVVFWITFGVLDVTTLVYVIWASGEKQSWNENSSEENWLRKLLNLKSERKGEIVRERKSEIVVEDDQ